MGRALQAKFDPFKPEPPVARPSHPYFDAVLVSGKMRRKPPSRATSSSSSVRLTEGRREKGEGEGGK